MSESDDDIRFRDRCAMEIIQGIMSRAKPQHDAIDAFLNDFESSDVAFKKIVYQDMEKVVRAAYRIADMMRKTRLASFE